MPTETFAPPILSNTELLPEFPSAVALLDAAVKLGLEVVSKKRDQPYVSGRNSGWVVKCKTAVWRQANRDRWEICDRR